jgi:hypothetical protein
VLSCVEISRRENSWVWETVAGVAGEAIPGSVQVNISTYISASSFYLTNIEDETQISEIGH